MNILSERDDGYGDWHFLALLGRATSTAALSELPDNNVSSYSVITMPMGKRVQDCGPDPRLLTLADHRQQVTSQVPIADRRARGVVGSNGPMRRRSWTTDNTAAAAAAAVAPAPIRKPEQPQRNGQDSLGRRATQASSRWRRLRLQTWSGFRAVGTGHLSPAILETAIWRGAKAG
ncbi:hypothetical protein IF1G_06095 [Cordyceps javanica]|uniref:Uncharacterized protein n=1 Tax=Cordyceps javanica TaxID=43265 RepID=A0A545V071_9HYPO|nr:hypothetical protein IF1G_06095 [Cordyceps javanica]